MNVQDINRRAWNRRVQEGVNPYTQPVNSAQVAAARRGEWQIFLTPGRPVPPTWLDITKHDVLCLASGGGQQGPLYKLPYSDLKNLSPDEQQGRFADGRALEFGHTLDDLIGGQLAAGFVLTGFYEDRFPGKPVDDYLAATFATRALKPRS